MSARARARSSKPAKKPARKPGSGGRRAGAGRSAGSLPPYLRAKFSAIPPFGDPLAAARWYVDALAACSAARLDAEDVGSIDSLARELRANAAASSKIIPHDIMARAQEIIRDDAKELASDESPAEETVIPGSGSVMAKE